MGDIAKGAATTIVLLAVLKVLGLDVLDYFEAMVNWTVGMIGDLLAALQRAAG